MTPPLIHFFEVLEAPLHDGQVLPRVLIAYYMHDSCPDDMHALPLIFSPSAGKNLMIAICPSWQFHRFPPSQHISISLRQSASVSLLSWNPWGQVLTTFSQKSRVDVTKTSMILGQELRSSCKGCRVTAIYRFNFFLILSYFVL